MTLPATAKLCRKVLDTWILLNQKTAPIWFFTALWGRIFLTENRVTAHFWIKMFGAPNCAIQWMFLHEIFWHCETKHFDKTVMTPPLCENFGCKDSFEKPNGTHTKFFPPVRQNFLTEPWCPPPLHEIFRYQVLFRNTKWFPYDFSWHCERKISRQKVAMPFPLLLHSFISIPKRFWNDEGIPNEVFQSCETKSFQKKRDTPSYASKLSVSDFFRNAKGFPYQFSRCFETQRIFRQKCDVTTPPPRHPMQDSFRHQKFFEIQMCSPTRFIVSVKKKLNGEWWNPLLMHKILYTWNFLKYRTVTRRSLSVLWDTK